MPTLSTNRSALRQAGPRLDTDVLLEHGELGTDAAALAVVRLLRQPVGGAEDVAAQAQAPIAGAAVVPRRLGLHPVEERQA